MVDALHHLVGNLLTNLDTCIVGGFLLVVAGIGTLVQSLEEFIHVGGIHTEVSHQIIFQTLCLCHTDGIAQCVNIVLQVGLRGRVATRNEYSSYHGCHGYKF